MTKEMSERGYSARIVRAGSTREMKREVTERSSIMIAKEIALTRMTESHSICTGAYDTK